MDKNNTKPLILLDTLIRSLSLNVKIWLFVHPCFGQFILRPTIPT